MTQLFAEQCLRAALNDYCPPLREAYLCNRQEDDGLEDCSLCWVLFMRNCPVAGMKAFDDALYQSLRRPVPLL